MDSDDVGKLVNDGFVVPIEYNDDNHVLVGGVNLSDILTNCLKLIASGKKPVVVIEDIMPVVRTPRVYHKESVKAFNQLYMIPKTHIELRIRIQMEERGIMGRKGETHYMYKCPLCHDVRVDVSGLYDCQRCMGNAK